MDYIHFFSEFKCNLWFYLWVFMAPRTQFSIGNKYEVLLSNEHTPLKFIVEGTKSLKVSALKNLKLINGIQKT